MAFNIGHLVLVVASSWRVLELTGSPLWVSAMVGAPTVPLLLLALPAGAVADLFDRKIILMASSGTMMLAAGGMVFVTLAGLDSPGLLVALGMVVGVGWPSSTRRGRRLSPASFHATWSQALLP